MDLDRAIAAHAEWKVKFRSAIETKAGTYTDAEAMLGNSTPFSTASTDVGWAIIHLRKEAGV